MQYTAINIQGNILSGEVLDKIRNEEINHQKPADFSLHKNTTVRDEINTAWNAVRGYWMGFSARRNKLTDTDTGTTETRERWMKLFLEELGYQTEKARAYTINQKSYAISHKATNRANFPVHIVGINQSLDKRAEIGGTRLSPHALVQEFLNNNEHLYALVTNGKYLRLLRDATRLSKLNFIEFDLERIMDEELFNEFALLFRLLHATRMPLVADEGEDAVIEYYHQESLSSGSRIREKLSLAVEKSIKNLANGLLSQPQNAQFAQKTLSAEIKPEQFYLHLLRLVYRLLFLLVIEERKLIYPEKISDETAQKRNIYQQFYSLARLLRLAEKHVYVDPDKTDLWQSLILTFRLFENKTYGQKLNIQPLGSGLFAPDALGELSQLMLNNANLLQVLKGLIFFENKNQQLTRVNYADLNVEEFGSVYEGLLEYNAAITNINGRAVFSFVKSTERSSSGSHYTPEELVKPLIQHSLRYVIENKVAGGKWLVVSIANLQPTSHSQQITNHYKIAPYETFKKLSGIDSMAKVNELSQNDLHFYKVLSERRDIWIDFANLQGISKHSGQHSRRTGQEHQRGISSIFGHSQRFFSGSRDFDTTLAELEFTDNGKIQRAVETMRRDKQIAQRINQVIKEQREQLTLNNKQTTNHSPLTTQNYQLSTIPTEEALLQIRVADPAAGSGHILLSAAREIAFELACLTETRESNSLQKVEQPSKYYYQQAKRAVITNCIYGVDKNPLAVELCKVALWLEAHTPGEPLNFLDHRIKHGDSLVGLAHRNQIEQGIADEAFATLPNDDKDIVTLFRNQNKKERKDNLQLKLNFDKELAQEIQAVSEKFKLFSNLPETNAEQVRQKEKEHRKYRDDYHFIRLKQLADAQTAQFFLQKTEKNKDNILTDYAYRKFLRQLNKHLGKLQDRRLAKAESLASEQHFFHWFLEFPEVFDNKKGFDVILGNPPYLGGQKLTGTFGYYFTNYIKTAYAPIGSVDLVTYFFRRNFDLIRSKAFISLISTNTIAQGDARGGGLAEIEKQGGTINHAAKLIKWPGAAAVDIVLVTIHKGQWKGKHVLSGKEVNQITSYLDDSLPLGAPYKLKANENKSFQGSIVLGKGFILTPDEAQRYIAKDPKNTDVLFPYLNGDDLNSRPDQSPSRWVINFFDWPLRRMTAEEWNALPEKEQKDIEKRVKDEKSLVLAPPNYPKQVAADYPDLLQIVEREVKPQREEIVQQKIDANKSLGVHDSRSKIEWWLYLWPRIELYKELTNVKTVLVQSRVSKTHSFHRLTSKQVFSDATLVFVFERYNLFSILVGSFHEHWSWQYSSTMKGDRRYSVKNCFETFPFPENLSPELEEKLEQIGQNYHAHRQQLMQKLQLGLTKLYNQFHNSQLESLRLFIMGGNLQMQVAELEKMDKKQFVKQFGKESYYLWAHLQKEYAQPEAGLFSEQKNEQKAFQSPAEALLFSINGIAELRRLHTLMDNAVLEAYGWSGSHLLLATNHSLLTTHHSPLNLNHNFYEVDYLPENDRTRYTISPQARKEVLKRLLLLNHARYEQEIKDGLHKKKEVLKFYTDKGLEMPTGIEFSDGKKKKNKPKNTGRQKTPDKTRKPQQTNSDIFGSTTIEDGHLVTVRDMQGTEKKLLLKTGAASTDQYEAINFMSVWYNTLLGRSLNERIKYMGKEFDIVEIKTTEK